jgi:hypothetical protein
MSQMNTDVHKHGEPPIEPFPGRGYGEGPPELQRKTLLLCMSSSFGCGGVGHRAAAPAWCKETAPATEKRNRGWVRLGDGTAMQAVSGATGGRRGGDGGVRREGSDAVEGDGGTPTNFSSLMASIVLTWPTPKITIFVYAVIIQLAQKIIGIGCIKIAGNNNIAPMAHSGPQ